MLELRGITTHYGAICAVNGVSLQVRRGEIVSLIGANGAGKTTLLMTVCGNPRASGGSIWFEGENITNLPTHQTMRKGIAISPEGRRVFSHLTVEENLKVPMDRPGHWNIARVYDLFPRLVERKLHMGRQLS